MKISQRTTSVLLLTMVSLNCFAAVAATQQTAEARQARLAQIRGMLETLQPTLLREKKELQASLHSTPALLYADNARDVTNSSLWVWVESGQPVGVTAIEWHPGGENQGRWTFEFATLCSDKIRIALPPATWTTSDTSRLAPISNAPAVADTRPQLLIQMKQLSERFTVVEQHPTEGRIELRRLTAPVYCQTENGDSAMFVFANGTNPEVVLLIAVVNESDQEKTWGYRAAALSSTELTLKLDDRTVWGAARFTGPGTRGTYINGALKVQPDLKLDPPSGN